MQFIDTSYYRSNIDQAGFTLVEIVMVVAILGIIGVVGADFIAEVFRGFNATNTRLEIYEEGKSALARMERELHGMLPNAICVTNNAGVSCVSGSSAGNEIRFGLIAEDAMRAGNVAGGYQEPAIDFPQVAPSVLTDVNGGASPPSGGIVSVYNSSWNSFAGGSRLFAITSVAGNTMTFGGQAIIDPSPQQRYYLLDRGISYRWDSGDQTLYRKTTTVGSGGIGSFASSVEYPMAKDISDFRFYYAAPSLARNGLVSVVFTMSKGDHNIVMHKEIHVKNVP